MQEGRAEWVTSLLFFHFVRITTPQAPKTRLSGGERTQCPELVRTGGHAVAARAGAPGIALHARRRAGGLGPAEEPLRLGAGGAAEGERRPGRRRGEVPPRPARVRPDALPRPVQPRLTGLAVPTATSCCHVRLAPAPSRGLPAGDRSSAPRRHLELAGRHLGRARTSRRQSGRARAPEPDVSRVHSARAPDTPPRGPRLPASRHP